MRGQRLFVRPLEASDAEPVRLFLERESPSSPAPSSGLLGKLVGNLVAVLAIDVTADALIIRDLVVARDLRKKRIGRFMLDELVALASKMDRDWLVIGCEAPQEFRKRVGFDDQGKRMVKRAG